MNAEEIASEVRSWFVNAVSDMAFEMVTSNGVYNGMNDVNRKKIENAKRDGVEDIQGWFADELYNDEDCFYMIADKVLTLCEQNQVSIIGVYNELKNIGHATLQSFCEKQIKYYSKKIERPGLEKTNNTL